MLRNAQHDTFVSFQTRSNERPYPFTLVWQTHLSLQSDPHDYLLTGLRLKNRAALCSPIRN